MVYQYIFQNAVPYVLASDYWIIIFWVRYSPYTVYAEVIRGQELRLKYGWEMIVNYLYDNLLVDPHKFHFEKHDVCFGSNEPMSRWEAGNKQCRGFPSVLESDSFKDLLEALREIKEEKPNANVLIMSVDTIRFGAVPEQHEQIRKEVTEANKKTQFLFLQQAFLDQIPTVIRTYNYLCARADVYNVANQVNPAKSLDCKKWAVDAKRRIREDASNHKQQLRQGEGETADFIVNALALGKQIEKNTEAWVEEVKGVFLEAQRNGLTPDEASEIMSRLQNQTTVGGEKYDLIILRWSSQRKECRLFQEQQKYVTKDGVHCFQAAIGVSLMNDTEVLKKFKVKCCPKSRTIVIMDAYKDRTNKSNEGLVFALSLVLGGRVNAIFTPRFNRINNQVFKNVCETEGVPIIAWDCLGLSIDDYIAEEKTRVTKLENATATKNEEEATAVATTLDNTPGKIIYEDLKQLTFGRSSISESLMEYVKEEDLKLKFSEQDASLWRKNKSLEEGDDGDDWEDDNSLISAMSEEEDEVQS